MTECQVAVVGAGIAGCLTAIHLADAGRDVVLIDQAGAAMSGASRWNEGKIHLGYCYLGDAAFATPALMLDGAARFVTTIEQVTGRSFREDWFSRPVIYIVDPDTQFSVDHLWARSQRLANLLRTRTVSDPGLRRFADGQDVLTRLDPDVAAGATGLGRVAAAWQTSERCVAPGPVAAMIREAVEARKIPLVKACARAVARTSEQWSVRTDAEAIMVDAVVNASWESRALLDRTVIGTTGPCSIRFKYGLFGQGLKALADLAPSTRIVGRFGDVTPYGNGEAYLSWYPEGLAAHSDDGIAPIPVEPDRDTLIARTLAGLGLDPEIVEVTTATWEIRGGYVVAHGSGDIDRASSPLHLRDRFGAFELSPGYVTVDTGKYSCGPMVAAQAAALVDSHLRT